MGTLIPYRRDYKLVQSWGGGGVVLSSSYKICKCICNAQTVSGKKNHQKLVTLDASEEGPYGTGGQE